ncbi:MAG: BspA family leucine-rich repeat surface protein, partial [Bacteroidota bacterium]
MKRILTAWIIHLAVLSLVHLTSCGDDNEPLIANLSPVITAQTFITTENIDEMTAIGNVVALDPEGETITFSIVEDMDQLFEITTAGTITLLQGKALDLTTKNSHELTVAASDGTSQSTASITIEVVDETVNVAPIITDQTFEAAESISETKVIGKVVASDANGDVLTFTITKDEDVLFEISTDGNLSLRPGSRLNYEAKTSHTLMVGVSDGTAIESAEITIVVIQDVSTSTAFVTTWEVTDADLSIIIPTAVGDESVDAPQVYDYQVDWGDGSKSTGVKGDITHTYSDADTYIVSITGQFPHFRMEEADEAGSGALPNGPKLKTIEAWGTIEWASFQGAFYGSTDLTYNATDTPDLSSVTSMANAFTDCSVFNGDLSGWDVSNVTNMANMFFGANAFNQDIGGWKVDNVTNMRGMLSANAFNQDLSLWKVDEVTTMSFMFYQAEAFDQDIGGWNVIKVTDMSHMFDGAFEFDQDIGGWDVDNVTDMSYMFALARKFNQNIGG